VSLFWREALGIALWIAGGGLIVIWSTSQANMPARRRGVRYIAGFGVAAVAGQLLSLGIERFTTIHTCHFVTLGLAMLGGALWCVGRSDLATRWVVVRALAVATIAILLLPWFLGAA
jgi:hypothetical protein